jgi:hypothetical protein
MCCLMEMYLVELYITSSCFDTESDIGKMITLTIFIYSKISKLLRKNNRKQCRSLNALTTHFEIDSKLSNNMFTTNGKITKVKLNTYH